MRKGKDKIKVLFAGRYNFTEILTGPEKVAKRIFNIYTKSNPSAFISYFFDGRKYGILKKLFGKETDKINNTNSTVVMAGLFRIFSILQKKKPDIVHIITYERFAVIFIFFKIIFRYKVIYHSHGFVGLGNKINKLPFTYRLKDKICEKFFFKYSDIIIFPSGAFTNLSLQEYKYNENKIRIIPNGVDKIFYKIGKINQSKSGNIKVIIETEKIGFGHSASFIKDALEKIQHPVRLMIIGKRNEIFKESSKVGLSYFDKMSNEDFADFLKENDVFVSLIRFDSFSISTAEAMSSGVIPIINEEIGIAKYITNGINGFKIKYNDSGSLAKYMDLLNCDIDKRKQMSIEASKIFIELSWEKVYKFYENLYYAE